VNQRKPTSGDRIRNLEIETLSQNWYTLRKGTFDYRRRDGTWTRQSREAYDRGNGACILLYNLERGTVLLTRQFRYPAWTNGSDDGMLLEVCAGLLDEDDPETAIRREAEEETGYRVEHVRSLFDAFMSPGSVTERLHFFVAEFDDRQRVSGGGGADDGNEDIELVELGIADALRMIETGEIRDAKTVLLLYWASATNLLCNTSGLLTPDSDG
jgi:nudix-type nucleoside diphosphatase (YffH/AdpP family)